MIHKRLSLVLVFGMLGAFLLFMAPRVYAANQVVSDCGDNGGANQLRAKVTAAQNSGGGTITFTCGPSITLLGGVLPTIITNTTINGGNAITLSGNNNSRIFYVAGASTLTLNNITLTKGYANDDGGAIRNDGTLNLNNTKFLDNHTNTGWSGGAIITYHALHITNSEFASNTASNGGALYVRWGNAVATITGSNFHDNQTLNLGTGWGGAILVFDGASATIGSSTFSANKAGYGGGIYNYYGTAILNNNSTLSSNSAQGASGGGGVYNDHGTANLTTVTLSGNSAPNGSGGSLNNAGDATLTTVTVSGSSAHYGGGINNAGTLTMTNATVNGNSADTGFGGGIYDVLYATLTNVTVSGNSAAYYGGGIAVGTTITLTNVTVSGNSAQIGGGISKTGTGASTTLKNTLIAHGASGVNCDGFTGGNFNLSDDTSCGFGAGRDNVNLLLGSLANNGGSTKTHLPSSNPASPAIDNGAGIGCPATDQRSISRPQGLACDVGAVEVQPATPTPTRTRTPTITPTRTVTRTPTRTATPTTVACSTKPDKPVLLQPGNTKKVQGPNVPLDWNDAHCATSYSVIVKQGSTTGATVFKKKVANVSQATTGALTKGQTYYWRVTAKNDKGSTKSDWWSFKVK